MVFTARLSPLGRQFAAPAEMTLMASAEAAGIALPSSCRNGTCRTCRCRLHQGSVRYRIDWPGVSLTEQEDGIILPCVAYPASDLLFDEPRAVRSE